MVPDGDNAFIHKALDLAKPGDILVIDGNGCTTRSLIGEVMFTYAKNCGIAGIVVDGAIRDHDSLAHIDLPVYAKAVTPQGPYKNGPGEINVPGVLRGKGGISRRHSGRRCGPVFCVGASGGRRKRFWLKVRRKFEGEQEKLNYYRSVGNNAEKHKAIYDIITEKLKTKVYEG